MNEPAGGLARPLRSGGGVLLDVGPQAQEQAAGGRVADLRWELPVAVTSSLAGFLSTHVTQAEEDYHWGELRLHVTSYLCADLPPAELLTSARTVVLRAGGVLVVRDPVGVHILPGGRREAGETPAQTVRREVREETGWAIGPPTPTISIPTAVSGTAMSWAPSSIPPPRCNACPASE